MSLRIEKQFVHDRYELAQTLDNRWRRLQVLFGSTNMGAYAHNGNKNSAQHDEPMDVDNVKVSIKKLTANEKGKCRKEGLCFYCRKQGHIADKCPEKGQKKNVWATAVTPTTTATPLTTVAAKVAAIKNIMDGVDEDDKEEVIEGLMRADFH